MEVPLPRRSLGAMDGGSLERTASQRARSGNCITVPVHECDLRRRHLRRRTGRALVESVQPHPGSRLPVLPPHLREKNRDSILPRLFRKKINSPGPAGGTHGGPPRSGPRRTSTKRSTGGQHTGSTECPRSRIVDRRRNISIKTAEFRSRSFTVQLV